MSKRLFIANIPYTATQVDLEQAFLSNGLEPEDVRIIYDRETKRSRGFGFAEMASVADAQRAISLLDGAEFEGRTLSVRIAEQRPAIPAKPRQATPAAEQAPRRSRGRAPRSEHWDDASDSDPAPRFRSYR